ncbi:ABC transporter, periplasmic branched chain amino acid binding protein [Alloalcanivorax dieselolei B5]|uniref:ABC transporter, periplasmic branched chain amino acid binding protein n=2 Tax=Alloalcanivorax TaxID=3020832 RepID=K0CB86_ALCDB|nr:MULTISPECIES: branched-chain amino acid ABC transporter substrate-binding protein [Alloalcanivorax]AFT69888.1 ABC transporter, periplasmic branched chain amino acid binding protein [Alloalcanivorax dieselolei B5]MCU5784461.1 Leu/Ile/Val-binding protein-like protein [Alloalcanivorax balearicus MACL04]GGJ87687.1 branched-chain amino acid ABC transporter substrate-binding protein [Alloalcanivorax dieselolei]
MLKPVRTLVTASLLLAGSAVSAAETVKLALIDPLTGPMAAAGQPAFEHLKLEAERINANGGLNGAKLEIVGLDNKVNPQESLVQLQKAINDGVQLVTQGNGSSVASALITSVEKHNRRNPGKEVLYLNYAAVDPAFTNERCSYWHFRFDANADMKMNALTNYIANNEDIHKVYLINQDYSFGHAVSKSAQEMLKQKRPDIEIVGNDFHPLAKVKDFTPYVSKIQASGADAVISGNWGQDITLLVKAAAEFGLKAPFYTYYGASSGVVTQLGDKGVDRIYQINEYYGDFEDPEMAKRQVEMYEKTNWDFYYLRLSTMLDMLKAAADKAGSTDPKDLAKALEGLSIETPTGEVTMRAEDHQIQLPMFISVMKDGMKYGAEGTDYNFHKVAEIARDDVTLPTTCRMRRPN